MRKKYLYCVLALTMCFNVLTICVCATEKVALSEIDGDVWDGTVQQPTRLVQKDGIYYYAITKCSELAYVAETGGDWLSYNYILENNLILNDIEISWDEHGIITNSDSLLEWTVMGNFTGIFNGDKYYISGIYIDSTDYASGLFSSVNGNGCIMNLDVINSYVKGRNVAGGLVGRTQSKAKIIDCSYSGIVLGEDCGGIVGDAGDCTISGTTALGTVKGVDRAGGICGNTNSTSITNCTAKNEIFGGIYGSGGLIGSATNYRVIAYNSYSTGNVHGNDKVGGFIGYGFNCTIKQCFASGNVTANEGTAGGFIGKYVEYSSIISDCYAFGDVSGTVFAGGFAGSCADDIINCYCLGKVSCDNLAGGFIGEDRRIWGEEFTVINCYYLKEPNYNNLLFGTSIAENDTIGEIEGIPTVSMKSSLTFSGWNYIDIWAISSNINSGYPYFQWQYPCSLGDINGDTKVDISDAIRLFQYSMMPELYPISYSGNVDFTKDGTVDISDAIRLFQYSMMPELYPIT